MTVAAEYFGRTDLERAVEHILSEQYRWEFTMAECPDALQIRAGATTRCTVRRGDGSITEAMVVVKEAAGSRGRIGVEPADRDQP